MKFPIVYPDDTIGEVDLNPHSLSDLQNAVGGLIQVVSLPELDEDLFILVNEEGLILQLPRNLMASQMARMGRLFWEELVGPAILMAGSLDDPTPPPEGSIKKLCDAWVSYVTF